MPINTPLYSCVLSNLAYEWRQGWRWPYLDTDLCAFLIYMWTSKLALEQLDLHNKSSEVNLRSGILFLRERGA